jgi:hypothetical protein
MTPPVLTTEELAARWSKPAWQIRRWCAQGAFPGAWHVGQRWLIVCAREGTDHLDPTT